MGFFEKKFCDLCSNKVNVLTRQKLSDGYLCSDCKHKLSALSMDWKSRGIEDVKRHLEQREQNKIKFSGFVQSVSIGTGENLVADYKNRQFYFATGRDYKESNPEIFDFSQLQDFWTEIGYTSMTDSDHDGIPDSRDHYDNRRGNTNSFGSFIDAIGSLASNNSDMNIIPPALLPYVHEKRNSSSNPQRISSIKAVFVVTHEFISEITISVDSYISENNRNALSKAFLAAQQLMQLAEQIRSNNMQNSMGYQQNTIPIQNNINYQKNNSQSGAFCSNCGYHLNGNDINSKFCPNCGSKR